MAEARWQGQVIAASDVVEVVEGNLYFPRESLKMDFFRPSATTTVCGWKGTASYFDVVVDGEVNKDAAWTYETPKDAAKQIRNHVAFWRGVAVSK